MIPVGFSIYSSAVKCSNFGNFQFPLGIPIFRVRTPVNSLLGAFFFSSGYNFAEHNDDDAPENGASELITIYNKYDY